MLQIELFIIEVAWLIWPQDKNLQRVKPRLKCHVFSPIEMSLLVLFKDM